MQQGNDLITKHLHRFKQHFTFPDPLIAALYLLYSNDSNDTKPTLKQK